MGLNVQRTLMREDQIAIELTTLDGWSNAGQVIRKTWEFDDFVQAIQFVDSVAVIAERFNHHPDIDIRWTKVVLSLSTHSAGGLTPLDFIVAKSIDTI